MPTMAGEGEARASSACSLSLRSDGITLELKAETRERMPRACSRRCRLQRGRRYRAFLGSFGQMLSSIALRSGSFGQALCCSCSNIVFTMVLPLASFAEVGFVCGECQKWLRNRTNRAASRRRGTALSVAALNATNCGSVRLQVQPMEEQIGAPL